ncbi:MAG: SDR family NAD(P)-dependent oxidoreductase, partial [Methylococcaceae bacterium]
MTTTRPLAGKVAIVTGSTSGIGLGIARALAQAGADVVINGLGDPKQIEAVCEELEKGSPFSRVAYNGANLMDGAEARKLIEDAIAEFGRVDILVNNAG